MKTLFILIGCACSGKSSVAARMQTNVGAITVSTDQLRAIFAWEKNPNLSPAEAEGDQSNNGRVFGEVKRQLDMLLENPWGVIYDATNMTKKARKDAVKIGRQHGVNIVAVYVSTPLAECLRRNDLRERKVPVDVIERQFNSYEAPIVGEEVDELILLDSDLRVIK